MDEHDRKNLKFLLNASDEVMRDWYQHVSEDDRQYAAELLQAYSEELREQSKQLRTMCEMTLHNTLESTLNTDHYPQAAALLAKFRL